MENRVKRSLAALPNEVIRDRNAGHGEPGQVTERMGGDPAGQPTPRHPVVMVLIAVVMGVLADRFFAVWLTGWLLCFLVGLIGWGVAWRVRADRAGAGLLLLSALALGAGWHHLWWNNYPADAVVFWAEDVSQPVCLRATALQPSLLVTAEGRQRFGLIPRDDLSRCEVWVTAIRDGRSWRSASGKARLRVTGDLADVQPGDRLQIYGQLRRTSAAHNPGEFSFRQHERAHRRQAGISANYPECVSVLQRGSAWNPRWWVPRLREAARQLLWQYLPGGRAELAAALLLGYREFLPPGSLDVFLVTGTIHLLAISGLHVGILASLFYLAARTALVPTRLALGSVMWLTVLYAALTGGRAPVVRATILVFVICLGWLWRRQSVAFNSLAASALIVLGFNPCQLFQVGAQLSFLAVAAMVWFIPRLRPAPPVDPVKRFLARHRSYGQRLLRLVTGRLGQIGLASVVIWCVALPLVMYRYHLVAPVALVLNLFLWIPIALSLFSGFGVLVCGFLLPPVAGFCAAICSAGLGILEGAVNFSAPLDYSHFWVVGPKGWWVLMFYVAWAVCLSIPRLRRWWPLWTTISYGLLFAGCWGLAGHEEARAANGQRLSCTFLSMGHGTCVVLELPGTGAWLYDAGCLGDPRFSADTISRFLWDRGISQLRGVVLSHADADHYNAVPMLLPRFDVHAVYVSPAMFLGRTAPLSELRDELQIRGIPLHEVAAGDTLLDSAKLRVTILHPRRDTLSENDNANSLVLSIAFQGRRILLPGDLEADGLEQLLSGQSVDCDLLLAPHHGSPHSDPSRFCEWCTPEWIVISGGHRTAHSEHTGFHHGTVPVWHTASVGAVEATIVAGELSIRSWRGANSWAAKFP